MSYTGFDWDSGNIRKNEKHGVSVAEIEQVFLNTPLLLAPDIRHSQSEVRLHALGRTDQDRWLHITFTERGDGALIRPISARPMSRKEKAIYAQAIQAGS